MSLNELLDLIGIDEPDEFEYFENFADIVESDEEIPEETLAELFRSTDPETVSEIIEQYFDDIMNDLAWRNNICVILGIYLQNKEDKKKNINF